MDKLFIALQTENRDTFFVRVHRFVLPYHAGALLVAKAYEAAKNAHRTQKRKRGERYFEHCRAVAIILMDIVGIHDPEVIAAALLHDILEDCSTEWTRECIEREFGKKVAELVAAMTMPDGEFASRDERLHAYHTQLLAFPKALPIKLADRLHNLSTCYSLSYDKQLRMIAETEEVYLPLAKEKNILYEELCAVIFERKKEALRAPTV